MEEFEAIFYATVDGREPAREFILKLNVKMRAKVLRTITLLEHNGTNLRMPVSQYLREGIFELRAQVSTDITRVFYFFVVGKKAVLTNGIVKKTQKTPEAAIELAIKYRQDYLAREERKKK